MRLRSSIALALLVTVPARAEEDSLTGSRGPVEERAHEATLTLSRGHATLVVQRTVENLGKRHDQADWLISIPETAVATMLRTKGSVDGRPRWFLGELMEAEAAAEKYRQLTGIGGYYPKDPALLSWRGQGTLALQVFPVPPAERKTVSYTLKMPTSYRDGRYEVTLPRFGLASVAPRVVIRAERDGDRLVVEGQPFPAGAELVWPERASASISLAPSGMPAVEGTLGVKRFGDRRVLVHYRVEAAPRVARVPRDAEIVVILDWSRSLDDEACEAGIAAARAFLRHFEGARVEVLTVDRVARRRYGRFVPVATALADLAELTPERRNGSNVDAALARADALLAAAPASRPRRVLLLGDLLTREGLRVEKLQASLRKSGALLHVGRLAQGSPALQVDEDSAWSGVARATGGLLWRAEVTSASEARETMEDVLEEWARPKRVQHLRVIAPGLEVAPTDGAEALEAKTLDEGQGIAGVQIASDVPPWLEIAGELWARPVRVRVGADAADARLWSALAFGSEVMSDLSEEEMMVLARHGRAVSPVTSYLAIEPGVRPSTEGLEREETITAAEASLRGSGAGYARGRTAPRTPFYPEAWLRRALEDARRDCGYGTATVTLAVETTFDEIVDVPRVESAKRGDRACLEEAVWALELPDAFDDEHRTFTIALRDL